MPRRVSRTRTMPSEAASAIRPGAQGSKSNASAISAASVFQPRRARACVTVMDGLQTFVSQKGIPGCRKSSTACVDGEASSPATTTLSNFCSRRCAAQAKIARHFCQFSKLSKVVGPGRLENLKGFQPWVDIFPPANGICLRKNICISAAHEAILPIFQIVKIGRLCRLENPTGFQPFAGNDFTGGPAYLF